MQIKHKRLSEEIRYRLEVLGTCAEVRGPESEDVGAVARAQGRPRRVLCHLFPRVQAIRPVRAFRALLATE